MNFTGLNYQIKEIFPFFLRLHKDNINKLKSELSEKDSFIHILIRLNFRGTYFVMRK